MKRFRVEWEAGKMTGTMVIAAATARHVVDMMELMGREVRRITMLRCDQ